MVVVVVVKCVDGISSDSNKWAGLILSASTTSPESAAPFTVVLRCHYYV